MLFRFGRLLRVTPSLHRTFASVEHSEALFKNEVKDAELIFNAAWTSVRDKVRGDGRTLPQLSFPKEILWLGGAPGAGKGTNTEFIRRERGLTADPIVMSSLLNSPAALALKASGGMVGDKEVVQALMETLLDPRYGAGVIVDGFPRTKVQAEVARLLFDSMTRLYVEHRADPGAAAAFRRPVFRIVVLFVDESTSVERQMHRGKAARAHNEKVRATGLGELREERPTDYDTALAQKRYAGFNELTYSALQALGTKFIYNWVNAGGGHTAVEGEIAKEMAYQSTLELNPETLSCVAQLPMASDVTKHARQSLVARLDGYFSSTADGAFRMERVREKVAGEIYPAIALHALSGRCSVVSTSKVFQDEEQLHMAIDMLTERGFRVSSEPVVKGVRFMIEWQAPQGLNY